MPSSFEKARALAAQGIPVFPCHGDNKRPACERGFLAATTEPTAAWWGRSPLVGTPTGLASGYDVLDIDPKHNGHLWLQENEHRLPRTRKQWTRSGGVHLYFRPVPELRSSQGTGTSGIAPGVDVRATGGYVIRWDAAGLAVENPDDLADWPLWLLDKALDGRLTGKRVTTPPQDRAPPSAGAVVRLLDEMPNPPKLGRETWIAIGLAAVGCLRGLEALERAETDAEDEIREAWLRWSGKWIGADPEADLAKWDDLNERGEGLAGWPQLLTHAQTLGVELHPFTMEHAEQMLAEAPEPPPEEPESPTSWLARLLTTKKGAFIANLFNANTALRHCPDWRGVLAYNSFSNQVMLMKPPPGTDDTGFKPRAAGDVDYSNTAIRLQHQGINVSSSIAAEAISAVAAEHQFNPVQDYLNGLEWDGKPRIDTWLPQHLGAEDNDLNRAFGAKFLIGGIARALSGEEGVKLDTMLVLEGNQGIGKSSALRALMASSAWFADYMPDLAAKDAMVQLQGRLLIEFAELSSVRSAKDVGRVKSFLSTAADTFRPPYGRTAQTFPRRCVFAGTVNPGGAGYLTDPTGARRFWTVKCGVGWRPGRRVDVAALTAVRDQLWAEARHRWAAGEKWWLEDTRLEAMQADAAADRFEGDPLTEPVEAAAIALARNGRTVTVATVSAHPLLDLPKQGWDQRTARRICDILRQAGWTRRRRKMGYVFDPPEHLTLPSEAGAVVPFPPPGARQGPKRVDLELLFS